MAGGSGIDVLHRGHIYAISDSALDNMSEILASSMLESLGIKKLLCEPYNRLRKEGDYQIFTRGCIPQTEKNQLRYLFNGMPLADEAGWELSLRALCIALHCACMIDRPSRRRLLVWHTTNVPVSGALHQPVWLQHRLVLADAGRDLRLSKVLLISPLRYSPEL